MTDSAVSAESRATHVISQVYYYVAAVGGFGMFLGGAIVALVGVRELVLPRDFETTREGVRTLLYALSFVLPGLAVIWWHVRQARRTEEKPPTTVFWGRALYFHLMALVALLFVMIGTVGVLTNLGEAATSTCESCYPTREDALRNAVDASIFLIVAGPVFWWHLRQGRRVTAPPDVET